MTCSHPPTHISIVFPARDYVTGDQFQIANCRQCGLNVTLPRPSPEHLNAYYSAGYYGTPDEKRFPWLVEKLQDALYARRARQVHDMRGGCAGRVLDVGCGRGFLLSQFQALGWEVEGTELNDRSAEYARKRLGLPIHVGPLVDLPLHDNSYDAVILWHVLEHLPDPHAILHELRRVLKRGGVLLVAVPNFGSIESRLTRDGWFHLDVPRHLTHFTPAVLLQTLSAAGFRIRRTSYFAPEYDCFSFIQSFLNRAGFRHNLLYNLLRGRDAKVITRGASGAAAVAGTLLMSVPLGILSVPLTTIAALCSQGAAMAVHAERNDGLNPGLRACDDPLNYQTRNRR